MRIALAIIFAFISCEYSHGQELPVETPLESTEPDLLTRSHSLISLNFVRLADRLDSFFGETRADDEINSSSIRINHGYTLRMEKDPVQETNIRINLRLKNLENLFKFSIERNEKTAEEIAKESVEKPSTDSLPIRPVEDIEKEPWRFRMDAGLNANIPPSIFARSRLRKNWNMPWMIQRFTEELTWSSEIGWIQTTSILHDKQLSPISLLRFSNNQNWQITGKTFSTSHGPSILQNLTEDDALSYSMSIQTTVIDSVWANSNYQIGVFYRRNLKDFWLFAEVGPAIDFPRIERFRRAPSILFRLETFFSQK